MPVLSSRNLSVFATALVALCGCASVISGRTAQVKIASNPQNAHVSVRDQEGAEVASGTTPAIVSLKRGRSWFRSTQYTATISKPEYETAQVPIRSTVNPWVFGNLAAGGLIGLAVDGTTGAGWKPKPGEITQQLQPIGFPSEPVTELTAAQMPAERQTKTVKR
jgi:hypothetical protein